MGKQWKQWETLFSWTPKSLQIVTAAMKLKDLLLGIKAATNWDSILKSRDITLPAKVLLVKAMVFPVVMYGCAAAAAAAANLLQSCLTLCDPIDGSPLGSPIPGILRARTLEWAAISFSNAWKWKVKVKSLSRVRFFATPWTIAYHAPPSIGFPRQEYWSGLPVPSPVWMWELDYKESWTLKDWCFQTVVLEKTLESPLTARKLKQSILKEINLEYSLEGLMLKLQYFGHLIKRANSL